MDGCPGPDQGFRVSSQVGLGKSAHLSDPSVPRLDTGATRPCLADLF